MQVVCTLRFQLVDSRVYQGWTIEIWSSFDEAIWRIYSPINGPCFTELGEAEYWVDQQVGIATVLTLLTPSNVTRGEDFQVQGELKELGSGLPIAGATVHILINGLSLGSDVTDANGVYARIGSTGVVAGTYQIKAVFYATSVYSGSESPAYPITVEEGVTPPPNPIICMSHTGSGLTIPTSGTCNTRNPLGSTSISALPSVGWYFDHWDINGVIEMQNPFSFIMPETGRVDALAVFATTPLPPPDGTYPVSRQIHAFDNRVLKGGAGEGVSTSVQIGDIDTAVLTGGRIDYVITWVRSGFLGKPTAIIDWNGERLETIAFQVGQAGRSVTGSIDLTGRIGLTNAVNIGFAQGLLEYNELVFDIWVTVGYSTEPQTEPTITPDPDLDFNKLLLYGGIGLAAILLLSGRGSTIVIARDS